ncbi:MAG: hypothetical protein ACE5EX_11520, partial [Phycisphaerae bacterium]
TNWNLGGDFPDNDPANPSGAAGLHVTLQAADALLVDVNIAIQTLRLLNGATLSVTQTGGGDFTVDAAGGIFNDGNLLVANDRLINAAAGAVTLTFGARYAADPNAVGSVSAALSAATVTLKSGGCNLSITDQMTLTDTMTVTTSGAFLLDDSPTDVCRFPPPLDACFGPCPSSGKTLSTAALGGRTPPIFRIKNLAILTAASDFILEGASTVCVGCDSDPAEGTPTVRVSRDFDNRGKVPSNFDWINGKLVLNGPAGPVSQQFEAAGLNLGPGNEGFNSDADTLFDARTHTNFAIGTLEVGTIAAGANVTFANRQVNTVGTTPCAEALYVRDLTLKANSTITLDNTPVYYYTLTQETGVTINTIGCGELVRILEAPVSDGMPKNRYLSFSAGNAGRMTAVRVTFDALPPPFDVLNGQSRWVGPPIDVTEQAGVADPTPLPTFKAATLECSPHFTDWSTLGTIHVSHQNIVPGATYTLQVIDATSDPAVEGNFSDPATMAMSVNGDVVGAFDTTNQEWPAPDAFVDIGKDAIAVLDKFSNRASAPAKARVDLEPATPDRVIGIADVVVVIDAFRGRPLGFGPDMTPCP